MVALPGHVRFTEVGPRDGLQNEQRIIPTNVKARFVRRLIAAGHDDIEVSSFVRADRVPQLADASALFATLGTPPPGVVFSALVPNMRGLERAFETETVGKVAVFTAASETFNRHNVNASIAEALERFRPVAVEAKAAGLTLRGYVSTAFVCPYEGRIAPDAVRAVILDLLDLGCDEVSIGDTIGAARPPDVARLLDVVLPHLELDRTVLHLHDTRGTAVANLMEGLRHGVARYDVSSGGLGGCPFAPGAAGNLASEDAVFLLDGVDVKHDIDAEKQREASLVVAPYLGHALRGRVAQAPPFDTERGGQP